MSCRVNERRREVELISAPVTKIFGYAKPFLRAHITALCDLCFLLFTAIRLVTDVSMEINVRTTAPDDAFASAHAPVNLLRWAFLALIGARPIGS